MYGSYVHALHCHPNTVDCKFYNLLVSKTENPALFAKITWCDYRLVQFLLDVFYFFQGAQYYL